MPKQYSEDLRLKVIKKVEEGEAIAKVSRMFSISRESIYSWIRIKEKTGSIKAKKGYQKGHSHKIKDLEKFASFIQNNDGKTLKEMALKWPEPISAKTICKWLKRIGYTYKKKLFITQKETKT